jgi:hypothetical protein
MTLDQLGAKMRCDKCGKSPVHSDADRDVGIHGYCFFQVVEG